MHGSDNVPQAVAISDTPPTVLEAGNAACMYDV